MCKENPIDQWNIKEKLDNPTFILNKDAKSVQWCLDDREYK